MDLILDGGLPKNRSILLRGRAGTGKTTLAIQYLVNGILEHDEKGILLALEYDTSDLISDMKAFNWPLQDLINQKKLVVINLPGGMENPQDLNIDDLINLIHEKASEINATRLVIDSLNSIELIFEKNQNTNLIAKIDKSIAILSNLSTHCSDNYFHKLKLIEAEKMRISGNTEKAREYYDIAIQAVKESGFINEEALICEFTGRFYQKQQINYLAEFYLQNAYNSYRVWGAISKLKQLESSYPLFIINKQEQFNVSDTTNLRTNTTLDSDANFDFHSILKSLQTISQEIHYEKLVKTTLGIAMENTGAQKATVIENNNGKFIIVAQGENSIENIELVNNENIENSDKVPGSIIKYVIRTQAPLLIQNASIEKNFKNDAYVIKHKVKSVLCYPAIHKNRLTSIIYLENNLSSNVFTQQRLEIVNMLAAQTVISLENALLYENLEEKVKQRTTELQEAKEEIEESHKHISDSINYASHIQTAMLPSKEIFNESFAEHFILFKPRDVVSGDFYWAKNINFPITDDAGIVFVAADCTGHGVPGAFVSMLGISLLNEIVRTQAAENAAEALDHLRDRVKTALGQTGKMNEQKDGMDLALCALNKKIGVFT